MLLNIIVSLGLLGLTVPCTAKLEIPLQKDAFQWTFGDGVMSVGTRFRVEGLYGKNVEFLYSGNETDQTIIPARHTGDVTVHYQYGQDKYGYGIVTFKGVVRNKGIWGDPESIASTDRSPVKLDANVFGEHAHALNRHYLWLREIWIEATVNEMFALNFVNTHTFTAGLFPFELGRGIALGSAYATDPDVLGFYSPNAVDQYAPGFKLSGALDGNGLVKYDLYLELMTNRSDTTKNVNLEIRGQEYGRLCKPWRGFGKINWLTAGRLLVDVYRQGEACVTIEPYALYLDQREQKIESLGDGETKLGTIGFGVEAVFETFEWGFEFAQNVGRQKLAGWDRNTISMKSFDDTGALIQYNTQVVLENDATKKAPYTKANQKFINAAIRSQSQNGQPIGGGLQNAITRFRDPYTNILTGYMAVFDMLWMCDPRFKLAMTVGLATGDEAPNKDLDVLNDSRVDGRYRGFISLQEQYVGVRVNSAFLMSGSGRVPRLLSFPSPNLEAGDLFPARVSQFNDLIFAGPGAYIHVAGWKMNTNILSFWQESPTRIFDMIPGVEQPVARYAHPWLGIEFNLFAETILDNSMKLFAVTSVFLPGSHYSDVRGRGLDEAQQVYFDSLNDTGAQVKQAPLLGTDPAFTLNMGMEYRF